MKPETRDEPDEQRLADQLTWTVIPAIPGTRIEWKAEWCERRSVAVHAWVVKLDVIGRRYEEVDMSCVLGDPMVLNAHDQLQVATAADLEGTPGRVMEP